MIYLDSCIVIYAAEDRGVRGDRVRRRLREAGGEIVAISPLVILESVVGPIREGDLALRDRYDQLFERFRLLDLDEAAHRRAAELRARTGIRTPDALHLAAAQLNGCSALWTNDRRLGAASHGLAVDVVNS
ncbi:type II toxin-antitoxin system VapC family toxin [Rathayibacter sp. YIM 133350]|uniref:type II toxin-antitoxin system VapC family toxin n=1 Tax=Rathayibacter sp. YIM 133350 TaxID=3131992 RepID=UPI00307F5716